MQGAGYYVESKFTSSRILSRISVAAVTGVCFGLTTESIEAERAELIIFNVAATLHHVFRCIHKIQSIDQRLEHEFETNRRNYEEEWRHEHCVTGEREQISEMS